MKVMVLDGNSIINRAFYGVRDLKAPDGSEIDEVEARALEASHPLAEKSDNANVGAKKATLVVAVGEIEPETVDVAAGPGEHQVSRRIEAKLAPGSVCRRDVGGDDQKRGGDELFHL